MNTPARIGFVVKVIIFLIAWLFLIYTLLHAPDLMVVVEVFRNVSLQKILILLLVLFLAVLNWSVEGFKWKFLLKPILLISFVGSLKSVLYGISVGLATPNRLGEFAGRVVFLPRNVQSDATLLSLAGSFSQLFVTLAFGIIGFISLLRLVPEADSLFFLSYASIIAFSALFMLIMLVLYRNTHRLGKMLAKIPLIKKYFSVNQSFTILSGKRSIIVLLLSALRYGIFLHQFYLCVWLFDINISYVDVIIVVSCLYLLMATIPVISAGEPGLRASLSIVLFALFTNQPAAACAASLMLWIINIAVPAAIGSFFLLKTKHNDKHPTRQPT
ncbi:MAG TPA: lysylphosphatidylglycerol synthase domain-containing protein [Bacteroidales bacterium]|nr:lysylphosphatidylglycerol synthase domain-containing protein [Bacteroidales bacterium]